MLKISYKPSTDSKEMKKEYETVNDFLQGQYLEVPPLQDHFVVTTVTLDGKEIEMPDQTSLSVCHCWYLKRQMRSIWGINNEKISFECSIPKTTFSLFYLLFSFNTVSHYHLSAFDHSKYCLQVKFHCLIIRKSLS
ncbi:hypothetical protein EfmAA290_14110 [Enterococcus faecium]|nr:hypothetical protein EfmAA290_14110 [Enterococcus faecium]